MKTLYIGETRKDFLENWKSHHQDLVVPKIGMPAELEFYQRMCKQTRQCFTITNPVELRIEYASTIGIPGFNHSTTKIIHDGYNYSWRQIQKEHHEVLTQGHRRLISKVTNNLSSEDRLKVEAFVDFNYKLDCNKPEYFRMLQHMKTFETDKNNNPLFLINLFSNITYLKKKEDCTLAIKMPDGKVLFYKFNVYSKTVSDFGPFSQREISILQLLTHGLSSKQISNLLFISPHTVDTHRRNMLEMTNCVDTTALIVYCRMLGIYLVG